MSDVVIAVEKLGKKYSLRHQRRERYTALRDVLAEKAKALFRRNGQTNDTREDFWALRDISFELKRGEVLGIIGRNGAGKSTLLKILSRITEPTTGKVRIKGRVASLLEVGTGFHPELTGRENIYLNGAILGMSRVEVKAKFDEMVAFAEVERFLDTPVKRYSSGMYVRLAFAVAAHLEPEILVVDEVLSVGDAQFQKKCLGRMQRVSREGRTVLFVSHNMVAVRMLCTRAVLLDQAELAYDGDIEQAIAVYQEGGRLERGEAAWPTPDHAPGDDVLRLRAVRVLGGEGMTASVAIDKPVQIEIEYWVRVAAPSVSVSIHLNYSGSCAFVGGTSSSPHRAGCYVACCTIPPNLLNTGVYSITAYLITDVTVLRVEAQDVVMFSVEETRDSRTEYFGPVKGFVRPRLEWETKAISAASE
jgi:lipopolysaccharide transport system ATP-binding protein